MEKWQDVLKNGGISIDKLRKKVKEGIADYNDALNYLESAKQKLAETTDEAEKKEIENDIREIENDLPALNEEIVAGIKQDLATLEKRRETAKKAFAGKEGGRRGKGGAKAETNSGNTAPATPPASTPPTPPASTPPTPPASTPPTPPATAAQGGVVEPEGNEGDGKEKKKGGFGVTEIVVGGVLGAIGIGLGLHYIYPDFFSKLFKKK